MKKILFIAVSSLFLWSCNNNPENLYTDQEIVIHEELHNEEDLVTPELNNGEKWSVNKEMKPFLEKGEELVNTFVETHQTEYKDLARQVKEQNRQIVQSCTMDGKSHEELHKWLHPHMGLLDKLEEETDATEAGEIIFQLRESYHVYHTYFN